MNTKTLVILGGLLVASVLAALAQDHSPSTPSTAAPPGPIWRLTPEQRAARQQQVQRVLSELRAKRAAGTLSQNEKARLDYLEQAGGWCLTGVPRGPAGGAGLGPRNGTGPRAQMGLCPLVNDLGAAVGLGPGAGPGRGLGRGFCGGRGAGLGGGWGWRDRTGPRARMGQCPLVNPPTNLAPPAPPARGPGAGPGVGGGRGWGRGDGWGRYNATGPRAQDGTCPLLSPAENP